MLLRTIHKKKIFFSNMSNCDRKRGLTTIIANLKQQKFKAEGKLVIHVYFFFSLSKVSRVSSGRQAGEHSAHFRSQPCISAGRVLLSVLYSAFRRYHHAHRWPLMFLFLKKKKKRFMHGAHHGNHKLSRRRRRKDISFTSPGVCYAIV